MRVGVLFPLSGAAEGWGRECANGALAAIALRRGLDSPVADANESGAAARLVREGATLVIGTLFTALALEASRAAIDAGAAYAEVAAVVDELGARGLPRFLRTCPRASAFGARAVDFALDVLAGRRFAIVYEDSAFGRSLGAAVARRSRECAATIVAELARPADTNDFRDVAGAIAQASADVVLAASYKQFAQGLWRDLRASGMPLRALVGVGGGWLHLHETTDVPADGVFAVDVAPSAELAASGLREETLRRRDDYRNAYHARTKADATIYSDLAFAGADLLLDAFVAARGDPDAFAAAARQIDVPEGGTILGYGARFDAAGENERAAPVVMQHGGALTVVYPERVARARPNVAPLL